jgi:hypothetical protein
MGGIAVTADIRSRDQRRRKTDRRTHSALLLACLFSIGAAVVHAVVCPEHFKEATLYGLFFLFAAAAQAGWAVLAWTHRRRWLLYAAAAGNTAVVALWAVTRINGVPLGPGRGEVEAIGALDVLATGCEVGVIVCALLALRGLNVAVRRTSASAINA